MKILIEDFELYFYHEWSVTYIAFFNRIVRKMNVALKSVLGHINLDISLVQIDLSQ